MLLHDVYRGPAIIDGRAPKRDAIAPTAISVCAMGTGSISEHVNRAVNSTPIPCAYVGAHGEVWILSGGGSGVIAFAGDDPSLDQSDRISLLVEALEALGGVVETLDEPEPVKSKRKNRKQVEVEAEPVDVPEAEPEVATDLMAWTLDNEGEPF